MLSLLMFRKSLNKCPGTQKDFTLLFLITRGWQTYNLMCICKFVSNYSGPHLIRPANNWTSCLIGHNSSTYFEAELSGSHFEWSPLIGPPLYWAKFFRIFAAELGWTHCISAEIMNIFA